MSLYIDSACSEYGVCDDFHILNISGTTCGTSSESSQLSPPLVCVYFPSHLLYASESYWLKYPSTTSIIFLAATHVPENRLSGTMYHSSTLSCRCAILSDFWYSYIESALNCGYVALTRSPFIAPFLYFLGDILLEKSSNSQIFLTSDSSSID